MVSHTPQFLCWNCLGMQIWFGIGDHEVQISLHGPGLRLSLAKPGLLEQDGCSILPDAEIEEGWEYEIRPIDRGYLTEVNSRGWAYEASYLWVNPNTQVPELAETRLVLCREEDASWGLYIYPEGGTDLVLALPLAVAETLEAVFRSYPAPHGFVPVLIPGGASEDGAAP